MCEAAEKGQASLTICGGGLSAMGSSLLVRLLHVQAPKALLCARGFY